MVERVRYARPVKRNLISIRSNLTRCAAYKQAQYIKNLSEFQDMGSCELVAGSSNLPLESQ